MITSFKRTPASVNGTVCGKVDSKHLAEVQSLFDSKDMHPDWHNAFQFGAITFEQVCEHISYQPLAVEFCLASRGWTLNGKCTQTGKPFARHKDGEDWNANANKFLLQLSKNGNAFGSEFDYYAGSANCLIRWNGQYSPVMDHQYKPEWKTVDFRSREIAAKTPTVAAVLYCRVNDATMVNGLTFRDFCGEFGFSTDSIKDRRFYLACQEVLEEMRPYLAELEPLFENY